MRWWFPPFAECAKDGAPTAFSVSARSEAGPPRPEKRARAIVKAATHYQDPKVLLEVSEDLVGAMVQLLVRWMKDRCYRSEVGEGDLLTFLPLTCLSSSVTSADLKASSFLSFS